MWSVAPRMWRQYACRLRRCVRYTRLVFHRRLWARAASEDSTWWASEMFHPKTKSHTWVVSKALPRAQIQWQANRLRMQTLTYTIVIWSTFLSLKCRDKKKSLSNQIRFAEAGEFRVAIRRLRYRSASRISWRVFSGFKSISSANWMSKMTEDPWPHRLYVLIYFTYEHSLTHSGCDSCAPCRSVSREPATCKHAFIFTGYTCTVKHDESLG